MGLIDKMIMTRMNRLSRKLIRLNSKLDCFEKERAEMRESLKYTSLFVNFTENYYQDKILTTKNKIAKTEKSLAKNYDKYCERNFGGFFGMSGRYPESYEED